MGNQRRVCSTCTHVLHTGPRLHSQQPAQQQFLTAVKNPVSLSNDEEDPYSPPFAPVNQVKKLQQLVVELMHDNLRPGRT